MTNEIFVSLPTELLHRIFYYCDSQAVFLSVGRVRKRLKLVTEIYEQVQLNVKWETKRDSELIRRLIEPSMVDSLTVLDDYSTISKSHEDISFINIHEFTHLRSLTFRGIGGAELENR